MNRWAKRGDNFEVPSRHTEIAYLLGFDVVLESAAVCHDVVGDKLTEEIPAGRHTSVVPRCVASSIFHHSAGPAQSK